MNNRKVEAPESNKPLILKLQLKAIRFMAMDCLHCRVSYPQEEKACSKHFYLC